MVRGIHALVLVAACGSAPPSTSSPPPKADPIPQSNAPTCKQVGDHLATLAERDPMQDDANAAKPLRDRCAGDAWSADARSCFATAQSPAELDGCRQLLTSVQRDAFARASGKALPANAGDPWNAK
jgi:hypothetical protein